MTTVEEPNTAARWARVHLADGLSAQAVTAGADGGRPVLLLHGFPQTPEAWLAVMEALGGSGLRLVAPAQRGYAGTARPRGTDAYGLDHLVADVVAIADDLGWSAFSVVGHDWGGIVAWAVAASHPDRIRRLAVLSTPHPAALVAALRRGRQALRSLYAGFFQLPVVPEAVLGVAGGTVLRLALRRSGLPARQAARYVEALRSPAHLRSALAWYRATSLGTLGTVGPVSVPTLYVWSDRDAALGGDAARATADHVTGPYRFEVLRGASHWLPETEPAAVASLVREHLGVG